MPSFAPAGPLSGRALYCPEEYLKWSLRWKGLEAATTEMMTGLPGDTDEGPAIIVYSLSRSSELAAIFREVREELTSVVSLASGVPFKNSSDVTEDKDHELLEVIFSASTESYASDLHVEGPAQQWRVGDSKDVNDTHSFLARLRIWDGQPAAGAYTFVQSGRSHYRVELVRQGGERLTTVIGEVPSVIIYGRATRLFKDGKKVDEPETRQFTIWRSDDERYVPLRFEVETRLGLVNGTLEDYRRPETRACVEIAGH